VNAAVIATTFGIVFLAELPDKTALASLVLATKYRPLPVFAGAAVGFAVQVAIALAAGQLLALLPHRVLEAIVAGLFLIGAVLIYRQGAGNDDETDPTDQTATKGNGTWRALITSFTVITVAEFGDLTQIVTANLAAKYDWLSVGLGALVALWAVAALAILGGQALLRVIPLKLIVRAAALIMMALAAVSLASAIEG
jgi:putative Ca2+/H+ antiporter (TMEM165/GDT1 family)